MSDDTLEQEWEDEDNEKDLCLNCGTEVKSELWGGKCFSCPGEKNTVHIKKCTECNENEVGYICDDDYCSPDILVCTECMTKARGK